MSGLENVVAGDVVILWPSGRHVPPKFLLVERTTKTQIVVDGLRYLRHRGTRVGETSNPWMRGAYIQEVTEDTRCRAETAIEKAAIEARRLAAEGVLLYARLSLVPLETLETVAALLEQYREEKPRE